MLARAYCWNCLTLTAIAVSGLSGCANLQVPAIDPTGARVFLPTPSYTTLESPCRSLPGSSHFPRPAFTAPPAVPNCATLPSNVAPLQTVAPPPRPPRQLARPNIPDRLILTPSKLVAPVGSEVVLLAGLCGSDGHYLTKQPVEWLLSQESVGNFVAVGEDNSPAISHLLHKQPQKLSSNFAVARTSTQSRTITRGTTQPSDDIWLQKGQTWVTVTSAAEGTSYVTALAAKADNWEQRRQTASIQWVDAQWVLPSPAIVRAGKQHGLTTTITRSTTGEPVRNWIVRYKVLSGPPVGLGIPPLQEREERTDAQGRAPIMVQPATEPGVTQIQIDILSPSLNGPDGQPVVIGQGTTTITWSAPALALRVLGPSTVAVDAPVTYQIEVSNPGDMHAEDVIVTAGQIPTLLKILPSDGTVGDSFEWSLGTLAPYKTERLTLECRTVGPGNVRVTVKAEGNGVRAEPAHFDTQITESAMRLKVDLAHENPNAIYVGDELRYTISVLNTSNVGLHNVSVRDTFDVGLEQSARHPSPVTKTIGYLAPGAEQQVGLTFFARRAGQLRHKIEVFADGNHQASRLETVNAREANRELSLDVDGPVELKAGTEGTYTVVVRNSGDTALTGIEITVELEDSLNPLTATGRRLPMNARNVLRWRIPEMVAAAEEKLDVVCGAVAIDNAAEINVRVSSDQGLTKSKVFSVRIGPAGAAPAERPPAAGAANAQPPANGRLIVQLSDDPVDAANVGDPIVYTLKITNDRQVFDEQVQVTLRVSGLRIVAITEGGQVPPNLALQGIDVGLDIGEMAAGESRTFRVETEATFAGEARIDADVFSRQVPDGMRQTETTPIQAN